MRNYLLAVAASAFLITACGEDSTTNAGDSISSAGSLYVDESRNLIVMTPYEMSRDLCVLENNSLVWKTINRTPDADSSKYEFIGDTLILYEINEGVPNSYGDVFIGGTAGNIYGTWTDTGCNRKSQTGETECYTNTRYSTRTFNLTPGKATAKVEYHFDLYLADAEAKGYMNSYFMEELYKYLNGGSYLARIIDIFNTQDAIEIANVIESNNVQIIENAKTNQTFKIGDKTYTVTVKKTNQTLNYNGSVNREAIVEVTDGATTCSGNSIYKEANKDLCKTENLDYFIKDSDYYFKLEDGSRIRYASHYQSNNENAFKECIKGIALKNGTANPLYKKATDDKINQEKRAEKLTRKMLKYVEN